MNETNNGPRVGFALHITLLMAFDGLRSIVSRFGDDHINEGECMYASEQDGVLTPVCIVGQFFADLGILRALVMTSEEFSAYNRETDNYLEECNAVNKNDPTGLCNLGGLADPVRSFLDDRFGITFEDPAWHFLKEAQGQQDRAQTWGYSVEHAASATLSRYSLRVPDTRTETERLHAYLNQ